MNFLAIDTTTDNIVLALKKGDCVDYFVSEKDCKKHNSILLGKIDSLLKKNDIALSDIDAFGVSIGPGSFTGIRIGVATVNALAFATNKPIVEVTTLETPISQKPAMSLLDCRHGNYYCGVFTDDETEYINLTAEEAEKYDLPKIYIDNIDPQKLLQKCVDKFGNNQVVDYAKPFYLRRSSAELETGIKC